MRNSLQRRLAKFLCLATLFLIFLGGLVKSTESGLSVPDWPTTYGHFMFTFPLDQWVGGIKYEHSHRLAASLVGLMTLGLCLLLLGANVSAWIKRLSLWAVVLVIAQGIMGGLTVKFMLPVWLSCVHGILAQTFFLVTVLLAYGLSVEWHDRYGRTLSAYDSKFIRFVIILSGMIYVQLILGNIMRHTNSGLAIPDFPTMGGSWWPTMDKAMLNHINTWRFEHDLQPIRMGQIHIHLFHRVWALLILLKLLFINQWAYKYCLDKPLIMKTLFWLNLAMVIQIGLGISTVLSHKGVMGTTLHVAVGAVVLALSFLLLLRSAPVRWVDFQSSLKRNA